MIVVVTGGRDYSNVAHVYQTLNTIHRETPITELVHGAARGADTLASLWARHKGVECTPVYAEWKKFGKRAGALRNEEMLRRFHPALVVAFPGGSGTANCVSIAESMGLKILRAKP